MSLDDVASCTDGSFTLSDGSGSCTSGSVLSKTGEGLGLFVLCRGE